METSTPGENRNGKNTEFVNNVTELNVHLVIKQIKEKSPIINEMVKEGKLKIVGGVYQLATGTVEIFED